MTFIIIIIEVRVTKLCFYLSILEDDIFRTLERIECNQPYYTTLPCVDHLYYAELNTFVVNKIFIETYCTYSRSRFILNYLIHLTFARPLVISELFPFKLFGKERAGILCILRRGELLNLHVVLHTLRTEDY